VLLTKDTPRVSTMHEALSIPSESVRRESVLRKRAMSPANADEDGTISKKTEQTVGAQVRKPVPVVAGSQLSNRFLRKRKESERSAELK
jgi:hypothetical protein